MDVSATEAARRFSAILDAVEHRGETYVIVRKGRPIARLGPAVRASGATVKEVLRKHARDRAWEKELREVRVSVGVEDRNWTG